MAKTEQMAGLAEKRQSNHCCQFDVSALLPGTGIFRFAVFEKTETSTGRRGQRKVIDGGSGGNGKTKRNTSISLIG